ncbi:MAG TPA: glutathione S-transferase family protein [Candidatus Binatus sp.]|jgi:glutathione S-transferase|nr:glutathione S-transferase family protein [Candidatus Binatus sp.]
MKLYRLEYSCYARKVQMALEVLGLRYNCIDVPFGNRTELAQLTGGYVQVPVLVDDDGNVTVDSRAICEKLVAGDSGRRLVPPPLEGPIWAYADWCDGPLEDVTFRLASPPTRRRFTDTWERALYVFVKERKFGRGCVDEWERNRATLLARARTMLEPSRATLRQRPFLFGDAPTLADVALYGQMVMLAVDPTLPPGLGPELREWMDRMEMAPRR